MRQHGFESNKPVKQERKMMYQYILFDLDGTLTDSKEGITKSAQYALRSFGIEEKIWTSWSRLSDRRFQTASGNFME